MQRCIGLNCRKVRCQQLLSLGQLIDRPDAECGGERPGTEEPCSLKPCNYTTDPRIRGRPHQEYIQLDPGSSLVKLKVGGRATVYQGTTVKVSCPVKHYDK